MFPAGGHLGFWIGPNKIHYKLPCKVPENLERNFPVKNDLYFKN